MIAIIAGEPNSINSEIIAKAWKKNKSRKNLLIIGNYSLLKRQIIQMGFKIPLIKIIKLKDFKREEKLFILDVPLQFKKNSVLTLLELKPISLNALTSLII